MKDFNFFRMALLGFFGIAAVAGVIIFATFRGGGNERAFRAEITMWGTEDSELMEPLIKQLKERVGKENFKVSYTQKRKDGFEFELLNALAGGTGPDIFLLPQDEILKYKDKIFQISFETYPERAFKDTFVEEGELYLNPGGVLALPFSMDPLILYWNRTMLTSAGIANPPAFWDEFFGLARSLTVRDEARNITKSAVALGEYANILHAKDILSALILQAGNSIVRRNSDGILISELSLRSPELAISPAEAAVRFFTEFSNPVKPTYSWNRALSSSVDMFTAGDLALYFGYAGERDSLRKKNPNLDFDTAAIPQARDSGVRAGFGRMRAVAIAKNTQNLNDAFRAATILSGKDAGEIWSNLSGLPPVRRDLLANKPSDAFGAVLYDSALQARGWLDPNPQATGEIFRDMIEKSVSGKERISGAVSRADKEISELLK